MIITLTENKAPKIKLTCHVSYSFVLTLGKKFNLWAMFLLYTLYKFIVKNHKIGLFLKAHKWVNLVIEDKKLIMQSRRPGLKAA